MPLKFSDNTGKGNSKVFSSASLKTSNVSNYAGSSTAQVPITKNAQFAGSAANVTMTQPMFFSPLHTPQNWQIASKRREIYQWSYIDEDDISPCYLTLSDGSLIRISEYIEKYGKIIHEDINPFSSCIRNIIDNVHVQDGFGNLNIPDKASKRKVNKKINRISVTGIAEDVVLTHDHNCRVIRSKDVKCKYHKKKNCTPNCNDRTCKKNKCTLSTDVDYDIKTVKASEIEAGDYFLIPFNTEERESVIKTVEEARFAGHLAADGWVCDGSGISGHKAVGVCMTPQEKSYISPCVDAVFSDNGLDGLGYHYSNNNNLLIAKRSSDKKIFEFASQIIKNKGKDKKFTEEVIYLKKDLQKHVIGAYIQSDGHYNKSNNVFEITTYSKHLANQLMIMCFRCGILARVNKQPISSSNKTFKTENKFRYIINIPSSECEKISEYVPGKSQDLTARKKGSSWRFFWKNNVVARIRKNEEQDHEGFVYDIRLPPSFTLTTNSVSLHQSRFYYENEPKVAAAIDFYSQFPMNGFKLECKSKKIVKFYEKVVKDLKLNYWLKLISHEYFMLGDVFPFSEISCPICGGSGVANGKPCNHPDGKIKRILVLNPDWIEVQKTVLANDPVIALVPDEELRMIVSKKQPRQIYDKLPQRLIELVSSGQPIHLSNRSVSHLKHNETPYATYGVSMIRRLFTVLAYKTKLMTANWIIAERLILPVRVVKIGDKERPASPDDIADVSTQLSAVANDPNLTLVTHHAFDYEWYGACYDDNTRVLTNKGIKSRSEIIQEIVNEDGSVDYVVDSDIEIMVFDHKTGKMRYEKPLATHVYDYDGEMINFNGNKIDMSVTPNHTMLGYKRDKKICYALEAGDFIKLNECDRYVRSVALYDRDSVSQEIEFDGKKIDIDEFLKFLGYYLSEGYATYNEEKRQYRVSVSQSPVVNSNICKVIDSVCANLNFKSYKYEYEGQASSWNILQKSFVKKIKEEFGHNSYSKRIPQWIKNLPADKLRILINAFCEGDASYYNYKDSQAVQIGTVSKQLSEDLFEIMFKAGYSPVKSNHVKKNASGSISYMIYCNLSNKGKGRYSRVKSGHISKKSYKGKVWCFETSTGFFVTERNGKFSIQGNTGKIHNITQELEYIGKEILDGMMLNQALLNGEMTSYSSAQVGVETMIRRLESWRTSLSDWVENHIFLPIAMMQGFVDEKESEELGEKVYLYPHIKWNDLNLRDNSNKLQMYMQLHDKKLISTQKLLEEFDIDYDQEVERIREEEVMTAPQGQMGGMDMGGMGGMDMGGMGGGMPPMDMGGGMGGMGGDMGGMGGDMGGMGGDMGGMGAGMGGDMGGMGGPTAGSIPPNFKISKRGNKKEEIKPPPPRFIKLTRLEQQMYKIINGINLPLKIFGQYNVKVAGQSQPYMLDFAFPSVGVGVEADGDAWHNDLDSKARDKKRDQDLANVGWRILRFNEEAIKENPQEVARVIAEHVKDAANQKKRNKKSSDSSLIKEASIDLSGIKEEDVVISKDRLGDLGFVYFIGTGI